MFVGDDPRMCRCASFRRALLNGGLWVDYDQRTNIPGLLAAANATTQFTAPTVSAQIRL